MNVKSADKGKVFYLDNVFLKELPAADETIDSINISGYASTVDVDRAGDVVPSAVWEKGLENYLKNPIVLAYHDYDDPCGRMIEHKIDEKGLWIKARISAAAKDVFNLVKDGILTAFSIGFRILDAEYKAGADIFLIKELELHEISVVAVPCNQNTLFSLAKSFDSDEDYKSFKMQFAPKDDSAKGLDSAADANSTNLKEVKMTPEEIKKMLEDAAKAAAEEATKSLLEKQAADKVAAEAAAAADKVLDEKVKTAVVSVESNAAKLIADLEKRFSEDSATNKSTIEGLEASLKEKAAEILAIQKSKMTFGEKGNGKDDTYADREKAVLLAKMSNKDISDTKFGRQMVEKVGQHLPSATWELEVSLNLEAEIRRRLIVAPLFRTIAMQTNVMTIPINPEAAYGTWVTNAQFGTTSSSGATVVHQLKEITLNAYKLATREYMAYEEEEDSLLALTPIIRDAMIRRNAKSLDKALLIGVGTGADPVKGLGAYASSTATGSLAAAVTVANLRAARKGLGALGLDPNDVTFIVNTEVYYDLLEDASFQTMDKVGTAATILTGQIGTVGNSPVLVSSELPAKASGTNAAATLSNIGFLAVYTPNFIVGNQRGVRLDTQELVETQQRVLVSSLRTGMTQLTTNLGAGVSPYRFTAA